MVRIESVVIPYIKRVTISSLGDSVGADSLRPLAILPGFRPTSSRKGTMSWPYICFNFVFRTANSVFTIFGSQPLLLLPLLPAAAEAFRTLDSNSDTVSFTVATRSTAKSF
jgi:hypothetical protein